MKSQQRLLLLDVMGTLVHDPIEKEITDFFASDRESLFQATRRDLWVRFEEGNATEEDFARDFFLDGRTFDYAAFKAMLLDAYRPLDGIEALLQALHAQGHAMVALSNYPVWYEMIQGKMPFSDLLDWRFVSCLTGHRKPSPLAYLGPLGEYEVAAEDTLFVDDRGSNCKAAHDLRIPAVKFESAEQLRRELVRRGFLLETH